MVRPLLLTLLVFSFVLPVTLRADEAALKQAVSKLFEVGWEGSYKTRKEADLQFAAIEKLAPGDVRTSYAYALVQIKQRRYPEAIKRVGELSAKYDKNTKLLRLKTWLSAISKNYNQSLTEMDRLSQLLPANTDSNAAKLEALETVQFLGSLVGYMEGPAKELVNRASLDRQRQRIMTRFTPQQLEAFETARRNVTETYDEFARTQDDAKKQAKVAADQKQKSRLDDLDRDRQKLEDRFSELGPEADKLRSEMKSELDEIKKEEPPLLQQLARLDSQRAFIQRDLFSYGTQIQRYQALADQEEDPVRKNQWNQQINQLAFQASQIRRELQVIGNQMQLLEAKRASLYEEYRNTQASYAGRLKKLDKEADSIKREEKKNDSLQKKAERPSAGDLRESRAIAARAKALTTYVELPLEEEKIVALKMYR